jgi:hypothetical protein
MFLWLSVNVSKRFHCRPIQLLLEPLQWNPDTYMANIFGLINCHIHFRAFWMILRLKTGNVADVVGKYSIAFWRPNSTLKN